MKRSDRSCRDVFIAVLLVASSVAGRLAAAQTQTDAAPLSLQDALAQARLYSQQLLSAQTAAQIAAEDRVQARAALLPSLNGFAQHIRTESNGTPSGVFVSNDGPTVYNLWGTAHAEI